MHDYHTGTLGSGGTRRRDARRRHGNVLRVRPKGPPQPRPRRGSRWPSRRRRRFINDALGRVVGAVREVVPKAVDCVKIESWVRTVEMVDLDTA